MNRIDKKLAELKAQGKKMLSPYITAGDPNPESTVPLMHALVAAGADILEIGIPFSDPMAEGPVIQAAMERALCFDMNCDAIFSIIQQFREKDLQTPIVLMGYLNPIEQYGYEKFAKRAHQVGVDGTILVDLPPEESEEVSRIWQKYSIHPIYLCSPTTSAERMAKINHYGRGYLYYVSLKGVTGSDDLNINQVKTLYEQRKTQSNLPIMVGFGIKTAEMATKVAQFADGVIVGAALVSRIFKAHSEEKNSIDAGASFIRELSCAMNSSGKNYE